MPRLACGVSVSVSVALLLLVFGSVTPPGAVTVAVFTRLPVALGEIAAETVKVTDPPDGRLTDWLILPEPDAVQVPPPAPTHVQFADVIAAGNVSVTFEPGALLGPAFEATIV